MNSPQLPAGAQFGPGRYPQQAPHQGPGLRQPPYTPQPPVTRHPPAGPPSFPRPPVPPQPFPPHHRGPAPAAPLHRPQSRPQPPRNQPQAPHQPVSHRMPPPPAAPPAAPPTAPPTAPPPSHRLPEPPQARKRRSRMAILSVALLATFVVFVVTVLVSSNWDRMSGKRIVRNDAASVSYTVPYEGWTLSNASQPFAQGTWDSIVESGHRQCAHDGTAGVSAGVIASAVYPRIGVTENPDGAIEYLYRKLLPNLVNKLVSSKPGAVQEVAIDGVRGARIDIPYTAVLTPCGAAARAATLTMMAFPTLDPTGIPITAVIYLMFDDTTDPGASVPAAERSSIVGSIGLIRH